MLVNRMTIKERISELEDIAVQLPNMNNSEEIVRQ